MALLAGRAVDAPWFRGGVLVAITVNAVVIGLETSELLSQRYGDALEFANRTFLVVFVLEALIKMTARWPRVGSYFRDGWNLLDFSTIVVSLLPATGEWATIARLARLFRVQRFMSAVPGLRLIVSTLIRSLPGMVNVLALLAILFYAYGVAGYHLFRDIDPVHWRTLGMSLLSLFRIVTLEDWTDIMYTALDHYWWSWAYFVSFVVVGGFVVVNLFIAVVINSLEEVKQEDVESAPTRDRDQLLEEAIRAEATLARLRERLERDAAAGSDSRKGGSRSGS